MMKKEMTEMAEILDIALMNGKSSFKGFKDEYVVSTFLNPIAFGTIKNLD